MNRVVFALVAILFLLSVLSITGLIQLVKADGGTIYINADGSITPSTAPITTAHNTTYTFYTFTGDVNESIVVEKDNIVVDGQGYTVQGTGSGTGITLSGISNVLIENTNIENFDYGAYLENSSNSNTISWNNITNNSYGVYLSNCSNISISANSMTQNSNYDIMLYNSSYNDISNNNAKSPNEACIFLDYSSRNIISNNDLTSYGVSIRLWFSSDNNTLTENNLRGDAYGIECESDSSNNSIYHNNFIGNANYVSTGGCINIWDGGYPAGGNYWSNYTGFDVKSGPYQNQTGSDGIGDTPYVIDSSNQDNFPLIGGFSDFNVAEGVDVQVVSNSTVSDFQFNGTAILFNVSGTNGTTGFCNVCIPTALLNGTPTVFVNGTQVQYSLLPSLDSTTSYLYFTYKHSTEQVIILSEFPSFLILPLMMMATLLAVMIYKKKGVKTSQS